MKRVKEYNSLSEIAPFLVKEWHPTANGNLTPRNLEVVYPKRFGGYAVKAMSGKLQSKIE